jgi:hypothetical protein
VRSWTRRVAILCLVAEAAAVGAPATAWAAPGATGPWAPASREDTRARWLLLSGNETARSADAAPSNETPVEAPETGDGRSRTRVIASGAALLAGLGLAILLKLEADDRFDQYLVTADPQEAQNLFKSSERYDRASLIGWVIAQAGFVLFFYALIDESKRPLVPVTGSVAPTEGLDGVQVSVRVSP